MIPDKVQFASYLPALFLDGSARTLGLDLNNQCLRKTTGEPTGNCAKNHFLKRRLFVTAITALDRDFNIITVKRTLEVLDKNSPPKQQVSGNIPHLSAAKTAPVFQHFL